MRYWQVLLRAEITAHIRADDTWDKDGIESIAQDSISLFPPSDDAVSLELENVMVDDVLEIRDDGNT